MDQLSRPVMYSFYASSLYLTIPSPFSKRVKVGTIVQHLRCFKREMPTELGYFRPFSVGDVSPARYTVSSSSLTKMRCWSQWFCPKIIFPGWKLVLSYSAIMFLLSVVVSAEINGKHYFWSYNSLTDAIQSFIGYRRKYTANGSDYVNYLFK